MMTTPQNSPFQKLVAIHQPNFFPWLGYFDKIRQADIFVLMDDVAYPKSGSGTGSWCNRVKVNIQGNAAWVGCPIRREHGPQMIQHVHIDDQQPWRKKILRTLEMNYRKALNYESAMALLEPLILFETDLLAEFNQNAIQILAHHLGLSTPFVRQSELHTTLAATPLLVEITQLVGGTAYLCGGGAGGYQEDALFEEQGLTLVYQNYTPTPYCPEAQFLPGLSVIDFLMRAERPFLTGSSHGIEATYAIPHRNP